MEPFRMRTRPTRLGQARVAAIAFVATLAPMFAAPAMPAPPAALAAQPDKACQHGLFQRSKPTITDGCAQATDPGTGSPSVQAVTSGFQEATVFSGLTNPTVMRFAADGRIFIGEKSGVIKVFDNLTDTTPTVFSSLTTNVHNFWDRGLLGLALDPFIANGSGGNGSYVYVLYAYDHILGSTQAAPRWGDTCPNPPGATTDGCVISARLSRFAVSGSTISGPEQPLVEDWCQQFPSHSIGSLAFGPDGALYVSAGDGASFNNVDYGQYGGTTTPIVTGVNPCGDPLSEGGALRAQDVANVGTGGSGSDYRTAVLADSPLAYHRLGEPSGSAMADVTGAHGGTYVGTPALGQTGIPGGGGDTAMRTTLGGGAFGQVSGWLTMPNRPASVEAWIKHDGSTFLGMSSGVTIAGWSDESGYQLSLMAYTLDADTIELGLYTDGGNAHYDWTPGGDTGWHHLVGTLDATGAITLFFDGVARGTGSSPYTGQASAVPFRIASGADDGATATAWPGSIDEVAVYAKALSPTQVASHRTAGLGSGPAPSDPTGLDGAILRLDPNTGAGMAGNPFAASSDVNARRIIAYGLRNPFRFTFRPGTNELWVGDVGWNTWEEVDRIPNATDAIAENFGWPCYEGATTQPSYDGTNLGLCESLYQQGAAAVTAPYYTYNHSAKVSTEACPTGSSSITGMAFYPESGSFPAAYRGGLFFADHSRNCIWFMPRGSNGQIDSTNRQVFVDGASGPVDLAIGPNGDFYYVDFDGGTIRRITPTGANQPPTAAIQANPTSGPTPLTVQFSGAGSSDPEGSALSYEWDLDGDGAYDDATGVTTQSTYTTPGDVVVGLRVTDAAQLTGTATKTISVANNPPVPVISTPAAGTTWQVGDLVSFSGSATDAEDGALPASALSWNLVLQHCPSNCHTHQIQSWPGVASGSFNAPDHDYPSYLELTLTATDSRGTTASVTRRLDPQTVALTFQSAPTGLSLVVGQSASTTQFSRTVIVGSANTVTATSPQTVNGATWTFGSWSDGGAATHVITAPATPTTYTANYTTSAISFQPDADAEVRANQPNKNFGATSTLSVRSSQNRSYLKFTVSGLAGAPSVARLRLFVSTGGTNGGSVYRLTNTSWTETGITWNNGPAISGSALSSLGTVTGATWVEFNLGSVITGNGTYTFAISGGNNNTVRYATRETANDPVLVLTP
jgi:glucose/arabinose dehydrogenase